MNLATTLAERAPLPDGMTLTAIDLLCGRTRRQLSRASEIEERDFYTAFPEGAADREQLGAAVVVVRLDPKAFHLPAEIAHYPARGIVAFSKLCTHVGCPVGLYQAQVGLLLCPCHQSTFDVLDGARPVFGPAARSLPQLPLGLNAAGEIIARADFSSPVGPGFWDRDR